MNRNSLIVTGINIFFIIVFLLLSIYLPRYFPDITFNLLLWYFSLILLISLIIVYKDLKINQKDVRNLLIQNNELSKLSDKNINTLLTDVKRLLENSYEALDLKLQNFYDHVNLVYNLHDVGGFIIKTDDLLNIESSITKGEIWISSHEIYMDIRGRFFQVIVSNIAKGIKYKYFLPKNVNMESDFQTLRANITTALQEKEDYVNTYLEAVWFDEVLLRSSVTIYLELNKVFQNIPDSRFGDNYFMAYDEKNSSRVIQALKHQEEMYKESI